MGQNPSDSLVNDMINEVDNDGSGVIQYQDFEKFALRLFQRDSEEEEELTRHIFRIFDHQRCGKVSVEEIQFVLLNLPVKLSEEESTEIVESINSDDLDLKEFRRIIGRKKLS